MIRQASPSTIRALRAARFLLLVFVTAFVAHDAVFLAHYGLTDAFLAIAGGGDHGYLALVGLLAAGAGVTLAGAAALRVLFLRRRLSALRRRLACLPRRAVPRPVPAHAPVAYRRELMGLWIRLFPTVAAAFTLQENLEHATHHHTLGLGALWSQEYPFALPVLAAVTFIAAAIGALVRWRIAILGARVATATAAATSRRGTGTQPAARWWIVAAGCLHCWTIARQDPSRAPPRVPRLA